MRSVSLIVRKQQMLPIDYVPGHFDVMCSHEAEAHQHNTKFRATIRMHLSRYAVAPNETVDKVIDAIRQRGVGFIRRDPMTNLFFEVGDVHARRKVSQAFKQMAVKTQSRSVKRSRYDMSDTSFITETEPPSLESSFGADSDDDEIVAPPPPPPLMYQSSFPTFNVSGFGMSKSGGDLLDDSDCSDVEHFFDIKRQTTTSCLIGDDDDCEEPL